MRQERCTKSGITNKGFPNLENIKPMKCNIYIILLLTGESPECDLIAVNT